MTFRIEYYDQHGNSISRSARNPETNTGARMGEMIQSAATEGDIDLRPKGSRAGNDDREHAKQHVRAMMETGHLTGKDAGARINYIDNAITFDQLRTVTADLPAMPIRYRSLKHRWEDRTGITQLFLTTLSVLYMILPSVAIVSLYRSIPVWGDVVIAATGISGLFLVISSLLWYTEVFDDMRKRGNS